MKAAMDRMNKRAAMLRERWATALWGGMRAGMVGAVCAVLVAPPGMAAELPNGTAAQPGEPVSGTVPPARKAAPLSEDQRVEHALSRFTFGARPGDVDAVKKMGLDAWFARQLDPTSIDDAAFEARMAAFPSLKLSTDELMRRYPSGAELRRAAGIDRKAPGGVRYGAAEVQLPTDPVEHAIWADAIYAYRVTLKQGVQPGAAGAVFKPGAAQDGGMDAGMAATAAGDAAGSTAQNGMAEPPAMQAGAGQDGMAAPAAKGKGKRAKLAAERMDPEQVEAVLALEPQARMARLVAMSPEEMFSFRGGLKGNQRQRLAQGLQPAQMEAVAALMQGPTRLVGAEALEGRLLRDIYSERQLQAVMTDFWLNHFNVYVRKNQNEPYFLNAYERETILPHALGKFENLLVATAESPAMQVYLDNWQSVGPDSQAAKLGQRIAPLVQNAQVAAAIPKGINENYARELMELHTLGVRCEVTADHPASKLEKSCGAGYTQADVQNVAKVLTGWTIERGYQGGGKVIFDDRRHEPGAKTVLGVQIPESGSKEGMEVLHLLANSPATAHFVCQKLAVRFVSDAPPESLVDRMAATWMQTGGDIRAVLTTMFHAPEFWAPEVYRAKIKTPIEFLASAVRASGARVNNPLPLVQAMDRLGMPIYGMQTPNGYAWTHEDWVSSNALIGRMNFALVLSGDLLPGTRTDWVNLLNADPGVKDSPTEETERKLEALLLGGPAADRTRQTVLAEFRNPDAQKTAARGFSAQRGSDPEMAGDDEAAGMMAAREAVAKKGGGGARRGDAAGLAAVNGPEVPLNTMAGLLMGSPEFQRR